MNKAVNEFVLNVITNAACKLVLERNSSDKIHKETISSSLCQRKTRLTSNQHHSHCRGIYQEGSKKCIDYLFRPLKFYYKEGTSILDATHKVGLPDNSNVEMHSSPDKHEPTAPQQAIVGKADCKKQAKPGNPTVNLNKPLSTKSKRLAVPSGCRDHTKHSLPKYSCSSRSSSFASSKLCSTDKAVQTQNKPNPAGKVFAHCQNVETLSVSTSPIVILEPRALKLKVSCKNSLEVI